MLRKAAPVAGRAPNADVDLASYDWIAVSSSAGKDSQAMLDYVSELAEAAGVADRIVVIHADLGKVEWEGTGELAREQAEAYGHRFELVSRIGGVAKRDGKTYSKGETYGDLLDYAERRGAWPDNANRWCTSDFKRGPILTVFTALAREWKKGRPKGAEKRACRILDCMGLRAEESPARAKKVPFSNRKSNKNQHIDSWLPIHDWTEDEVWARIKKSGVPHHPAYDLGMPRLSCAFCIFAPKSALVLAGKYNRELLDEYVRVEKVTGHKFRMDVSLEEVRDAVVAGDAEVDEAELADGAWNM
jgi:3'-phosphoadenosine 5'-phosphosulfate sulfotransferase (PAPS reductase)/FAD synthetase